MSENIGHFGIGSILWPGIGKLIEEFGEVVQVVGKLLATGGDSNHWDGTNLKERLEDELSDLQAAIEFVVARNNLDAPRMRERSDKKLGLFNKWHTEQSVGIE